jgi:hypothetical protein
MKLAKLSIVVLMANYSVLAQAAERDLAKLSDCSAALDMGSTPHAGFTLIYSGRNRKMFASKEGLTVLTGQDLSFWSFADLKANDQMRLEAGKGACIQTSKNQISLTYNLETSESRQPEKRDVRLEKKYGRTQAHRKTQEGLMSSYQLDLSKKAGPVLTSSGGVHPSVDRTDGCILRMYGKRGHGILASQLPAGHLEKLAKALEKAAGDVPENFKQEVKHVRDNNRVLEQALKERPGSAGVFYGWQGTELRTAEDHEGETIREMSLPSASELGQKIAESCSQAGFEDLASTSQWALKTLYRQNPERAQPQADAASGAAVSLR